MKTILLIDDDANIRRTYGLVLRHHGYRVFEAASGDAGLELARRQLPDLILSDIFMPGTDGQKVLQLIREDPDLSDTQVVLITGHPDAVPLRKGMDAGADDFLLKPVRLDDLIRCVEARLSRAQVHWRVEDRLLAQLRSTMHASLPLEFSTPLAGIIGLTGILRAELRNLSPDEIEDALEDLFNTALRLQRSQRNYLLVLDAPALARQELALADRLSGKEIKAAIRAGVEAAVKRTRRGKDLLVEIEDASVLTSQEDLSLMVEELVDNACNYSRGGTQVTVRFDRDGLLSIRDTGRGMSPEEIAGVGAFQQFDQDNRPQKGLGLGLVIVQKLADKWSAPFAIESTPEKGTVVSIAFHREAPASWEESQPRRYGVEGWPSPRTGAARGGGAGVG